MDTVCLRHLAVCREIREAHVIDYRLLGKQAKVLENHGDAAAIRTQRASGKVGDILPIDHNATGRGAFQQVDGAHQGGLARAAHADDAEDVAVGDLDVDIVQRIHHAVAHRGTQGIGDLGCSLGHCRPRKDGIAAHGCRVAGVDARRLTASPARGLFRNVIGFGNMLNADHE